MPGLNVSSSHQSARRPQPRGLIRYMPGVLALIPLTWVYSISSGVGPTAWTHWGHIRLGLLNQAMFSGQVPSKIEQDLARKNGAEKKSPPARNTNLAKGKSEGRRPRSPREYSVVFMSDVAGADISLDGNTIGKTEQNLKLVANVKPGQYKATATLKGYAPQSKTLGVYSDGTTCLLTLGKPLPTPTPTPTPVAVATPTPEPVVSPRQPTADEIIKLYVNPNETNKVTADNWSAVAKESQEALAHDSKNQQLIGRSHLARGELAYLRKDYAEAVTEFNRATNALPLSGIAYYGLGNAYMATDQPLEASKSFVRAIELTPDVAAIAHKGAGDAYTKLDRPKDAYNYYMQALELGYSSPDISKAVGVNLMKDKQWQKALKTLTAIESDAPSADLYLYIGECYENLKRTISAFRAYTRATELDPTSPESYAKLGDLLYWNNEFPQARDAYERALALDVAGARISRLSIRKLADNAAALAKKQESSQ